MIDATDFTIPGTGVLRNKLGITDSAALLKATDGRQLELPIDDKQNSRSIHN